MAYYLCPAVHKTWFVPGGNTPASGGLLFTYTAGSSTKITVYKDNQGSASHTNPIVLDSGGNLPSGSEVWIDSGDTIDVVFAPSNDTDPPASSYYTLEDLSGINDVNASVSDWVTGPTPTYVSGTQFVVQGDQSSTFKDGRRIKTTNTAGTIYSTISKIVTASGSTTINVVSDSGSLDSGLSAVSYSLIDPQYQSINDYYIDKKSAAIASAGNGTTNIWGASGNYAHITGTNRIYNFSSAPYAGAVKDLVFDDALILSHSASIVLPSEVNVTTAANDRARVRAETVSTAIVTMYERTSGRALVYSEASSAATQAQQETGTSNVVQVTPSSQVFHYSAVQAWGQITSTTVNES